MTTITIAITSKDLEAILDEIHANAIAKTEAIDGQLTVTTQPQDLNTITEILNKYRIF